MMTSFTKEEYKSLENSQKSVNRKNPPVGGGENGKVSDLTKVNKLYKWWSDDNNWYKTAGLNDGTQESIAFTDGIFRFASQGASPASNDGILNHYKLAHQGFDFDSKLMSDNKSNKMKSETTSLNPGEVHFALAIVMDYENPAHRSLYDKIRNLNTLQQLSQLDIVTTFQGKFIEGGDWLSADSLLKTPTSRRLLDFGGSKPFVFLPHIRKDGSINAGYQSNLGNKFYQKCKGFEIDSQMRKRIEELKYDPSDEEDKDKDKDKDKTGKKKKPEKSPAQIRKELGDTIRGYKTVNTNVVPYTPGNNSRLNTLIWDMSLAYYCYANSKEEKIAKVHAPSFYAGMWTPAEAPKGKINGRIEAPTEMIQLMHAVTRDAHKTKKGIFGNSKYRSAVEAQLGKNSKKWPTHWVSKNGKPGMGDVLGSIPGLEAYDPKYDGGTGYSSALFFKDLANDSKEPSGNVKSSKVSSTSAPTPPSAPVPATVVPGSNKSTGEVTGKAVPDKDKNKFIIISRPDDHPLYKFISKEEIERILTKAAPSKTVADFNSRATVQLIFTSKGELKKIKTSSNIGSVITTDDQLFNKKISAFKSSVLADIKAKIDGQKDQIAKNGIEKVRLTIENFSGRRRIYKESRRNIAKQVIKTSKAFSK